MKYLGLCVNRMMLVDIVDVVYRLLFTFQYIVRSHVVMSATI